MTTWKDYGFEKIYTGDHSPSLVDLGTANTESMHHRGGAAAESEYIYGYCLEQGLVRGLNRVLSVGLGLGYNELIAFKKFKQAGRLHELQLVSYELKPVLVESFLHYLKTGADREGTYAEVFQAVGVAPAEARDFLLPALEKQRWQIKGDFSKVLDEVQPEHQILLYDAFSSKTDPGLWGEDFLLKLFTEKVGAEAVLSTYACTGALKRSLKITGFEVVLRPGFQGKRECTFASRFLRVGFNSSC